MKKYLKLGLLFFLLIALSGCGKVTIEDARYIASFEKAKNVINIKLRNEQKEAMADSIDNNRESTSSLEIASEEAYKLMLNEIGDKVELGYMTCEVSDVLVSTELGDIYKFTDASSAYVIFKEIMERFGPDSSFEQLNGVTYVNEEGQLGEEFKHIIFIKVNVCNNSNETSGAYFSPLCYKKTDSGYVYISQINTYAMNNGQTTQRNGLVYEFQGKEESEFVMALISKEDLTDEDVYINADFVLPGGTVLESGERLSSVPTVLHSETQFIRIMKSGE